MDPVSAIGVVSSVLSVAEIGAQVALKLYRFADTVRTAKKDIHHIAKEVALFSAVLKDLHRVLNQGQKSRLFRSQAYENCRAISEECNTVFKEIRSAVRTGSDDGLAGVEKSTRLLWVFRKSKVELWQGHLESLKSTVAVQLAVLNYSEMVAAGINSRHLDDTEMKILILANRTAEQEYKCLLAAQDRANLPVDSDPPSPVQTNDTGRRSKGLDFGKSLAVQSHFSSSIAMDRHYASLWAPIDRLEHALRKVELAEWEEDRLRENDESGSDLQPASRETLSMLANRLERRLRIFGVSAPGAKAISMHLQMRCGGDGATDGGLRRAISSNTFHSCFHNHCFGQAIDSQKRPSRRWIADILDDTLWEITCERLSFFPKDYDATMDSGYSSKGRYMPTMPDHRRRPSGPISTASLKYGKRPLSATPPNSSGERLHPPGNRVHHRKNGTSRIRSWERVRPYDSGSERRRQEHKERLSLTASPHHGLNSEEGLTDDEEDDNLNKNEAENESGYELAIYGTERPLAVSFDDDSLFGDSESEEGSADEWAAGEAEKLLKAWTYVKPKKETRRR